jgi:hypothetical protein
MKHHDNESQSRLERLLRGAFAGPPTPLKDIPKKSGGSRQKRANGASAASAKNASKRGKSRA